MKIFKRLFNNPLRVLIYFIYNFILFFNIKKKIYYSNYLKEKSFFISFDCDTQKDIDYLEELLSKLNTIEIKILLAIPAELIEKNLVLFQKLIKNYEIEFLNHGYFIHTEFMEREKNYVSTLSYNKKDIEFIKKDILLAHNFFEKKLNIILKGFRAPHFGEINLKLKSKIYKFISELGYIYSSSSIYDLAILKGSIFKLHNITDLTVTGRTENITRMLDSWSFLENKNNKVILNKAYIEELEKVKKIFLEKNYNYLNIYADPSHIKDCDPFFEFLKSLAKYNKSFKNIKLDILN